jgi:hypothetical protein
MVSSIRNVGQFDMTHIDPMTQNTDAIWILVLREYLSAMNEDDKAPTREPKGIAQVIPPWRYDTGFPKYLL